MPWYVVAGIAIAAVIALFVLWSLLGLWSPRIRDFQLRCTGADRSPLHLANQAAIESNMGHPQQALQLSQRAIDIDTGCKEAWFNRGVALLSLNRPEEAEQAFREAIRIDGTFWQPWHNLAVLLQSQGKNGEADACMNTAQRLRAS